MLIGDFTIFRKMRGAVGICDTAVMPARPTVKAILETSSMRLPLSSSH